MQVDKPFVLFHRPGKDDLPVPFPTDHVSTLAIEGDKPPEWVTEFPVLFDIERRIAYCGTNAVYNKCCELKSEGSSPPTFADPDVCGNKRH